MKETNGPDFDSGIIDAADRVAQELLKTPKFKAGIKTVINSIDPQSAPQLVRTLMWEDTELFMAVLGAAPDIINAFITGGKEMIVQMEKFPPPVLAGFVAHIIGKIDGEALGSTISECPRLYNRIMEAPGEPVQKSADDFAKRVEQGMSREDESPSSLALSVLQPLLKEQVNRLAEEAKKEDSETGKIIRGLAGTLTESLKENPDFMEYVCKPFLEAFADVSGSEDKN